MKSQAAGQDMFSPRLNERLEQATSWSFRGASPQHWPSNDPVTQAALPRKTSNRCLRPVIGGGIPSHVFRKHSNVELVL